jgi:hypothetical protein
VFRDSQGESAESSHIVNPAYGVVLWFVGVFLIVLTLATLPIVLSVLPVADINSYVAIGGLSLRIRVQCGDGFNYGVKTYLGWVLYLNGEKAHAC